MGIWNMQFWLLTYKITVEKEDNKEFYDNPYSYHFFLYKIRKRNKCKSMEWLIIRWNLTRLLSIYMKVKIIFNF